MDRKQLLLSILILSITSMSFAIPAKLNLGKLPIQKDTKKYENKKYDTYQEYMQAFKEGKCSSMWIYKNMDRKGKVNLINTLIERYKEREGVIISKSAEYYVDELDTLLSIVPESKSYKLLILLRTIAVMDYDFDEGIDKDKTADKWLGPARFEILKQDMGIK